MARVQRLAATVAFAVVLGSIFVALQAARSHAGRTHVAAASTHSCLDMNGKSFAWSYANVPFAATCDVGPDSK